MDSSQNSAHVHGDEAKAFRRRREALPMRVQSALRIDIQNSMGQASGVFCNTQSTMLHAVLNNKAVRFTNAFTKDECVASQSLKMDIPFVSCPNHKCKQSLALVGLGLT